jgi:hypothetical protein
MKDREIKLEDVFNDEKKQGVKNLIDKHKQETLEKYSERFDNDKSEIGNPDTWGKRVIEEPKQKSFVEKMIPLQLKYNLAMLDIMKQETLEEASWKFNPLKKLDGEFLRAAFIAGAKWQQEGMYSEEEVCNIIIDLLKRKQVGQIIDYGDIQEWFQQYYKMK